ncbi:glycosyltransferase family 2 protein [Enterocloster aldenensis]|uniref:glycosyltransferase family 2 protein n=1 Tax=Enterocloster aldenensis TaxID=358742 RepID=UPI004025FF22
MKKVLTISVAAYNVEQFIQSALESLVIESILEDIEVFIVDDGGKDGTLDIAKQYEQRYPLVFHAVHKENGGYGSTVNYSVKNATGMYFKLLDGDDWFDSTSLISLVNHLKKTNADVIALPLLKGKTRENMRKIEVCMNGSYGQYSVKDLGKQKEVIGNPSICYKTSIIRSSGLELPEHSFYTDAIYSIVPFIDVKKIEFLDLPVYCYRTGRDEQSVSIMSKIAHINELINISLYLIDFYELNKTCENSNYICHYVAQNACVVLKTMFFMPISKESLSRIIKYENQVKNISYDVYKEITNSNRVGKLINIMRKTKYLAYWIYGISPLYKKAKML